MKIIISKIRLKNLAEIIKIDKECFTENWRLEFYKKEIENKNNIYLKSVYKKRITGFIGASIVVDESHIIRIAVKSEYRRKHIGTQLLDNLLKLLNKKKIKKIFLEVRESNLSAITFYKNHNFKIDGIRKEYYIDANSNSKETAILMSREI